MRRLALLCAVTLAGCVASAPLGLADWPSLDAPGRHAVATRLLADSDVTAFAGQRYALDAPTAAGPVPVVGGFIPGRVPGRRSELVVVAVPLDGPQAASLLDAVTELAARARFGQDPQRSVLVAFWRGPAATVADVVALPVWPRSARRVVLSDATAPAKAGAVEALVPVAALRTVEVPVGLDRSEASARWQRAILGAAAEVLPDSTSGPDLVPSDR